MIKKSQLPESSQLQDDLQTPQKGYKNHTPKLAKKPLSKFAAYQWLLDEFYKANPTPTEAELDQACLYFATKCGLTVAEKAKVKMGGRHV